MIEKFKSFIKDNDLITPGQRVLLAVSGGMDSMAMLQLFAESSYTFGIAHCNFMLRGAESDADEQFVKESAERTGVEYYTTSFDTDNYARKKNISIQMAARDLRYGFFKHIALANKYDLIATAHHLDDQAESFFINLSRGCGIAGLHGIMSRKGNVIRPLMFTHRSEIEKYVDEKGIPYREDSSNSGLKYTRNKIRHQLMPIMKQLNPAFDDEMARTIRRLYDTEQIFREYIELKKEKLIASEEEADIIDIDGVLELTASETFFYEIISEYGFAKDDVPNILNALGGEPGKQFFSPTHRLIVDRKKIIVTARPDRTVEEVNYVINNNLQALSEPLQVKISIVDRQTYAIPQSSNVASLDYHKLSFPMSLRRWKDGDAFIPLGMKNFKKLSDFFVDGKYSLLQKERCWLLCSGEDIVWVVGDRIDDRYKVTDETTLVYRMELIS
ncbi:MAG TPA: tRNA lysidine(34) synthetase TilS [Bacteroidales bacterium]|nr:tRNA lysidine(34) synthetase TilS [Bacteroidales bacterium]